MAYEYLSSNSLGNDSSSSYFSFRNSDPLFTSYGGALVAANDAALQISSRRRLHDRGRTTLLRLTKHHILRSLHGGGVVGGDGLGAQLPGNIKYVAVFDGLFLLGSAWLLLAHLCIFLLRICV